MADKSLSPAQQALVDAGFEIASDAEHDETTTIVHAPFKGLTPEEAANRKAGTDPSGEPAAA